MIKQVTRGKIVTICVASAFLLMVVTAGLGAAGVLQTTEQGDIKYISTEKFADGTSTTIPPEDYQFAIESPTDANAFYNAVIRANNGGPLINSGISETEGIMAFHYHPMTYYFYLPLSIFGYVPFKILLLIISIISVIAGTTFLLLAEREHIEEGITRKEMFILAVASVGVGPVLSNLKTGQTSPVLYFLLSLFWWGYRHKKLKLSGSVLATGVFFKPYVLAPIALGMKKEKLGLIVSSIFTYLIGTLLAIALFGGDELYTYFNVIATELVGETTKSPHYITSASNLSLLNWTAGLAPYLRIILFLPLFYIGVRYLSDRDTKYSPQLFSATLLSIFILLSDTSAIDMPLLLPAIIVIGLHMYSESERFWMIGIVFVLFHIHPLSLEILVGFGSRYVPLISSNQSIVQTFIPVLQPGLYSIFGLYYITLSSADLARVVNPSIDTI